ncbi:unnamed protein product [Prorocentrum cordatum]|uniref:Uncharacterized protein n=1 Tax=Prorocentrum cordatum TaxID=2364126 RepID=A0ABN9WWX8_9DINO|nr:unnamed protein product [Polarella glacialis]
MLQAPRVSDHEFRKLFPKHKPAICADCVCERLLPIISPSNCSIALLRYPRELWAVRPRTQRPPYLDELCDQTEKDKTSHNDERSARARHYLVHGNVFCTFVSAKFSGSFG